MGDPKPNTDEAVERVAIPLDPEDTLRALLKVDPEAESAEPAEQDPAPPHGDPLK